MSRSSTSKSSRSKKGDARQVARVRNAILAGVAALVIAVIAFGTLYSTGLTEGGEYQAGTHFEIMEDVRPRRPGEPIVVREFFSYGCVHCRNFDPMIEDWKAQLPDGVTFERTPVAFSPVWALLGRTYIALDELGALEANHERIFRAIHDNGRQFLSAEMLADFVDGYGVERDEFLRAFESPSVRARARDAELLQRRMRVASVPALVVDDKYRIVMDVGRKRSLDVVDFLIARELNGGGTEAGAISTTEAIGDPDATTSAGR